MHQHLNHDTIKPCVGYSSISYREPSKTKHSLAHMSTIIPTKNINEHYAYQLRDKIENDGIWTHPIVVEATSFFLLDGHHRYYIAQMLNLEYIPCVFVDYKSSSVDVYCRHTNELLDKRHMLQQYGEIGLLPYKYTKHVFHGGIDECAYEINLLHSLSYGTKIVKFPYVRSVVQIFTLK